jgi:hypothetical protein
MNERIRQLAEQAGYKPIGTFGDELMEIYNKKFAELIVRECANLFPLTFTDEQYQRRIDKTILKHFGVDR